MDKGGGGGGGGGKGFYKKNGKKERFFLERLEGTVTKCPCIESNPLKLRATT